MLEYRETKTSVEALDILINKAFKDKAEGKTKPHAVVRRKYNKWL